MVGGRIFGPGDGGRRRRRGFTGDFGWDGLLNFFWGVDEGGRREEVGLGWLWEEGRKLVRYLPTYLPRGSGVLLLVVVVVVVAKQQRTQRLAGSGNCTDSGSLDVMFPAPSVRRHGLVCQWSSFHNWRLSGRWAHLSKRVSYR